MSSPSLADSPLGKLWPSSFSNEFIVNISLSSNSKKQKLEDRIKEISGALKIAENEFEQCENELSDLEKEGLKACWQKKGDLLAIIEPLKSVLSNSNPKLNSLVQDFLFEATIAGTAWPRFLEISDEELNEMADQNENSMMVEEELPICLNIVEFFMKLRDDYYGPIEKKGTVSHQLQDDYEALMKQKQNSMTELADINDQLNPEHRDALLFKHQENLVKEATNARKLELALQEKPQLEKCALYIQKLIDQYDANTPTDFIHLRQMIDELSDDTKKKLKSIGTAESEKNLEALRNRHQVNIAILLGQGKGISAEVNESHRAEIEKWYNTEYPLNKITTLEPEQIKYYLIRLKSEASSLAQLHLTIINKADKDLKTTQSQEKKIPQEDLESVSQQQ